MRTLKEGETLTVPKGWTVRISDNRVEIQHKNHIADSLRGYSWHEFIKAAHKADK